LPDNQPPRKTITWHGTTSDSRITDTIRRGRAVQLKLPPEIHQAVLSGLVSSEDRGANPVFEIRGGDELIDELAAIDELECIEALSTPVRRVGYRIAVTSVAPVIFIEPPSRPAVTVPFKTPGTV
jgi:hypothetical protein